jgi:deoxyribodipyrimidine photo-lyase
VQELVLLADDGEPMHVHPRIISMTPSLPLAPQDLQQPADRRLASLPTPTTASRAHALTRLTAFAPLAGRTYTGKRNTDYGRGANVFVSGLSPYIRHRLITEQEVVAAVLALHSPSAAEKFIQEVCWRTYWKGWLEQRPDVWTAYVEDVRAQRAALRDDHALAAEVAAAERGETSISCFDAWAHELCTHGYLHNHTRMWFASIWIFTLKLPWALGADFFHRYLLDGDPASNTLSWRWVGGLQTRGKTYLARADNIETYTNGRFKPAPGSLSAVAPPLTEAETVPRVPLPREDALPPGARALLLVTEDELTPELWPLARANVAGVVVHAADEDGPAYSDDVRAFKAAALADARERAAAHFGMHVAVASTPRDIATAARSSKADIVVTARVPVGPNKDRVTETAAALAADGLPVRQVMHRWDTLFWPHATAGFFKVKDRIPRVLSDLGLHHRST